MNLHITFIFSLFIFSLLGCSGSECTKNIDEEITYPGDPRGSGSIEIDINDDTKADLELYWSSGAGQGGGSSYLKFRATNNDYSIISQELFYLKCYDTIYDADLEIDTIHFYSEGCDENHPYPKTEYVNVPVSLDDFGNNVTNTLESDFVVLTIRGYSNDDVTVFETYLDYHTFHYRGSSKYSFVDELTEFDIIFKDIDGIYGSLTIDISSIENTNQKIYSIRNIDLCL